MPTVGPAEPETPIMTKTKRAQRYVGVAFAALLLSACAGKNPEMFASPSADAALNLPKAVQRLAPPRAGQHAPKPQAGRVAKT